MPLVDERQTLCLFLQMIMTFMIKFRADKVLFTSKPMKIKSLSRKAISKSCQFKPFLFEIQQINVLTVIICKLLNLFKISSIFQIYLNYSQTE